MEKFSERLKIGMQVKRLRMGKLNLLDRITFLENLRFLYHTMKASEHLLRVGMVVARDKLLRDYYEKHLVEETDHVRWLERDLVEGKADFSTIPRESMLMVGAQYYMLFHVSPASLLGYMAALECFPIPMELVEALEVAHGKALLRTLRYHAEHDIAHGQDLLEFIDLRPHTEQGSIMEAATQATTFLAQATYAIANSARELSSEVVND